MDIDIEEDTSPRPTKKRRIPKACAACRRSKVRCDEKRPCGRCTQSRTDCEFIDPPKDPTVERFERLEEALSGMTEKLVAFQQIASQSSMSAPRLFANSSPAASHTTHHSASSFHDPSGFNIQSGLASSPVVSYHRASLDSQPGTTGNTWQNDTIATNMGIATTPDDYSLRVVSSQTNSKRIVDFKIRTHLIGDVVTSGKVTDHDARHWYATFFEGCDRFVPIFDSRIDTYDFVRSRSSVLFDIIIIYGCRAATGVLSKPFQMLYALLRQHTSDLVLRMSAGSTPQNHSVEHVQALLVIASYSDSGSVLCDVALRYAVAAGLPDRLNELFGLMVEGQSEASRARKVNSQQLFFLSRVWYGLFVLDQILSLDGGKPPSISLTTSPRRVRALLAHPSRSSLDIRLLAQVELNSLRSASYDSVIHAANSEDDYEESISNLITGSILDLDLWLSEWQAIVENDPISANDRPVLALNLRIQHAWASLALHLRALAACGIENIVLMTASQRSLAISAKACAETHLRLLLTDTTPSPTPHLPPPTTTQSKKPYVANFRYAMGFVWAKNAFCVLIVLRLAILLGDSPAELQQRLREAHEFLRELEKVGMGANILYTRILAQTVEKCERAVRASLQADGGGGAGEGAEGAGDFQSFIPEEFLFEWDFPGLNLCYIPLDWQDLFLDFGGAA